MKLVMIAQPDDAVMPWVQSPDAMTLVHVLPEPHLFTAPAEVLKVLAERMASELVNEFVLRMKDNVLRGRSLPAV